jgi:hypothetical protein
MIMKGYNPDIIAWCPALDPRRLALGERYRRPNRRGQLNQPFGEASVFILALIIIRLCLADDDDDVRVSTRLLEEIDSI